MNRSAIAIRQKLEDQMLRTHFSGSIYIEQKNEVLFEAAGGDADRSEARKNTIDTRFGIASGCKLFTAIAICQLVDKGAISFYSKLSQCIDETFPNFDEGITIHHLLTHTSGIPDYFDEDEMDDFEALWKTIPMYTLRNCRDFLPMFEKGRMKFQPGDDFHYNNAGYIILGLVVEAQTGMNFQEYIEEHVFKPAGMMSSGYFALDQLPSNVAFGYVELDDGSWKTNQYSIPVIGGADGGAYVTAPDMGRLWKALLGGTLLGEETQHEMFTAHVDVRKDVYYGYGLWIHKKEDQLYKYHVMGYDPGVSFHSAYYPKADIVIAVPSNHSDDAYDVMKAVEDTLID
ncbi:penicillin-binding protein [Pontibacillus chungwhensis BH030062]|uniref:Penicillin-binding protein n=1 Tax=Pontibacillus chungwhensis BH030062 TaxID=1385513 RepID=A0A0A2V088_9BACI|nr:serine hydrolase [Pontibacillus chungwhensis]KGP92226.1 penicillin-binding protein [Pontibacillus chungwhensis BH030062]